MPSEHRHVQCPKCRQQLRLTVTKKNFGKEVEVTCSKCTNKFRTVISYPARTHEEMRRQVGERIMDKLSSGDIHRLTPLVEEFRETMNEALAASPHLQGVVERMRRMGFDPFVVIEASIGFKKGGDTEPLGADVHFDQMAEILSGTFTEDEDHWMGRPRIKFDDN